MSLIGELIFIEKYTLHSYFVHIRSPLREAEY